MKDMKNETTTRESATTARVEPESAQRTPGPWRTFGSDGVAIEAQGGTVVANAAGRSIGERQANARLIAAAPEAIDLMCAAYDCLPRGSIKEQFDKFLTPFERTQP